MFNSCASVICFCLLVFSCFEVLNVLLFSLKISLSVKNFSIFGLNFRTFTSFDHGSSEFDLQTHKFLIETGWFFHQIFQVHYIYMQVQFKYTRQSKRVKTFRFIRTENASDFLQNYFRKFLLRQNILFIFIPMEQGHEMNIHFMTLFHWNENKQNVLSKQKLTKIVLQKVWRIFCTNESESFDSLWLACIFELHLHIYVMNLKNLMKKSTCFNQKFMGLKVKFRATVIKWRKSTEIQAENAKIFYRKRYFQRKK